MESAAVRDDERPADGRETWSAPTLTRLGAEQTASGGTLCYDGICGLQVSGG